MEVGNTFKKIGDFFEKFNFGILLTITIFIGTPILCEHYTVTGTATTSTWIAIITALVFIVLKGLFGDIATGEFKFHKYGYDNCMIAFSASLTALVLQIKSSTDIFKGFMLFPL